MNSRKPRFNENTGAYAGVGFKENNEGDIPAPAPSKPIMLRLKTGTPAPSKPIMLKLKTGTPAPSKPIMLKLKTGTPASAPIAGKKRRFPNSARVGNLNILASYAATRPKLSEPNRLNEINANIINAATILMQMKDFLYALDDLDEIADADIYVSSPNSNTEETILKQRKCKPEFCNPANTDHFNRVLELMDTYHDFWKERGAEPLKTIKGIVSKRLILFLYYLLTQSVSDTAIYGPKINMSDIKHDILNDDTKLVEKKANEIEKMIKDSTNDLFLKLTMQDREQIVKIAGSLETDVSEKVMCLPMPFTQTLVKSESKSRQTRYFNMLQKMFPDFPVEDPSSKIYIICDAGTKYFGKMGHFPGSKMRQIVTQCTIGDSALTQTTDEYGDTKLVGSDKKIVMFVDNSSDTKDVYVSNANVFTSPSYKVGYVNHGMTFGNQYDFSFYVNGEGISGENVNEEFMFGLQEDGILIKDGPAASLLSSYFMLNNIEYNTSDIAEGYTNFFDAHRDSIINKLIEFEATKGNNMLKFGALWRLVKDPRVFLDIKRGGDADQVYTAFLKREELKTSEPKSRVVFCTGDLLCATNAVRKGLATVYQSKNNTMKYWPQDTPMCYSPTVGGSRVSSSVAPTYGGDSESNISEYDIVHFLRNCCDKVEAAQMSKISSIYPELANLCSLYVLKSAVKTFYETNTSRKNADLGLKTAYNAYTMNTKDKFISLQSIVTSTDEQKVISNINQRLSELEKSLNVSYHNEETKHRIINDSKTDQYLVKDLRIFITEVYDKDQAFRQSLSDYDKKVYSFVKDIIFSDKPINSPNRNPYSAAVVSLSLLSDFITNNITYNISTIAKFIYGRNTINFKFVELDKKSLPQYVKMLVNIYKNYKGSADFMNVVPDSLKSATPLSTNKIKSTLQTKKNIQGLRNNRRKNTLKKIVSQESQPIGMPVFGGKRHTYKRHRNHGRKLQTRNRRN